MFAIVNCDILILKGKGVLKLYLTIKQQVKNLNKNEYLTLRELSHIAKNLTNEALYNICLLYTSDAADE